MEDFDSALEKALSALAGLGISLKLRSEQKEAVTTLLSRQDLFAVLPTGFGISTNINHKGLQWTANEYAEERRKKPHFSDFRYSQNSLDKTLRTLFFNSGASSASCNIALDTSRQFSHARFFTSFLV